MEMDHETLPNFGDRLAMTFLNNSWSVMNVSHIQYATETDFWVLKLGFIVLMIGFSVAGFFGNILIIATILLVRELRTTRNIFLVNLAVSDLVLIAIVVPFNIISVIHGAPYWHERMTLCMFVASVCAPGCLAAIWSNTGVAVNRFFFICHNELYDRLFSSTKTVLWILAIWFISFAIHFPNHVGWGKNGYVADFYLCTRETELWTYSTFFALVGIVLPLVLSFYSYFSIYRLVRTTTSARNNITGGNKIKKGTISGAISTDRKQSAGSIDERLPLDRVPLPLLGARSSKAYRVLLQELLLVKTLFRSYAAFIISWLPLAVLLMLPMLHPPTWVYLGTVFLAHGSTATNSILYYVTNDHFRKGFGKILRRMSGKVPTNFSFSASLTNNSQQTAADNSRVLMELR